MLRRLLLALLTFALLPPLFGQEELSIDPPPGSYSSSIDLTITAPEGTEMSLSGQDRFFAAPDSLRLELLPGESETFEITLRNGDERRSFSYTLDRLPPLPPEPEVPQGRYLAPVALSFGSDEVEYIRDGRYVQVPEEGLLLDPGTGNREAYTLRVRSQDSAGNRSVPRELFYVVDRTLDELATSRILLSPRPGTYRNPQMLIPDYRLWREVRYTVDGSDPEEGLRLREPRPIDGAGEITLRVGALHRVTGEYREEEITLTQGSATSPFPESGIYTRSVTLAPPEEGRYSFALGETERGGPRQMLLEPVELSAPPGNRRFAFFEATPLGEEGGAYGHAYLLDDRRPPEPTVLLTRTGRRSFNLTTFSLPEARISYTVSGTLSPGRYDYRAPVTLTLPEGVEEATVRVEVVAELPGGRRSPAVTRELPVALAAPAPPQLRLRERLDSESVELFVDASLPVYFGRLDSGALRLPPNGVTSEPFLSLLPPQGVDRTLRLVGRTVSEDGWSWSEPVTLEVPVDTLPPAPPSLNARGNRVALAGSGELEYRVTADLTGAPSSTGEFLPYTGAFRLEAPPDSVVTYRVEGRSRDDAGNLSALAAQEFRLDARRAAIPPIRGIQDGGRYREGELFLSFQNPYPEELSIFYELREEGNSGGDLEPTRDSQSVRERLRIETEEGVERRYALTLRAGFPEGPLSQRETIRFTVDRIPPEPPVIELPEGSSPFARDVEIRLTGGEGERYIAVSEAEAVDPLGPGGSRYAAPLRISGVPGEEREYLVTAASRDAAGNVTRVEEPVFFRIDRADPPPPRILLDGVDAEGRVVAPSARSLTLEGEGELFFSSRREGRSSQLREYDGEPVRLEGEPSSVVTYRIEGFAVDRAGNRSAVRRLELLIDRERPAGAGEPEIVYARDGRSGTILWPGELTEGRLYVAAVDLLELTERPGDALPRPIEGALRWRLPAGSDSGSIEVFREDEAGNRSDRRTIRIDERSEPPPPRLTGAPQDGPVAEAVTISLEAMEERQVEVRYTVSTTGTLPPPVTVESPLFGEERTFTAARGEVLSYVISARAFNREGEASEQQLLRFTIDREPPESPEIEGVSSGEYYPEAQQFSLRGEGEIYYRVLRQGREAGSPEFQVYRGGAIELDARENDLLAYQIEAYARDEAGNRSQEVEQWSVFIDREIVYVSSLLGGPQGEGSRSAPFASVAEGLELLEREERSTLFLGPGEYELPAGLTITRPIRIIGGFEGDRWRPAERISRLTLRQFGGQELSQAVRIASEGALTLRRVELASPSEAPAISVAPGGSLIVDASTIDSGGSVAVEASGGEVRLTESDIIVSRGGRSIRGTDGTTVVVRGGELDPIELIRSQYDLEGVVLTATPVTTEAATALIARESRGRLRESVIRSDAGEEHLLLVDLAGGSLLLVGSDLIGEAGSGVTLLRAGGTSLTLEDSNLEASGNPDFVYGILARGGSFRMVNSLLAVQNSASGIGISLEGGSAELAHNALFFSGVRRSFALSVGRLDGLVLLNSQLHNLGATVGEQTLLYVDEPIETVTVAGNNITGWSRVLTDGGATRQGWGFTSPGVIRSLEELQRGDRELPSIRRLRAYENIGESAERTFESGADALEQREFTLQIGSGSAAGGVGAGATSAEGLDALLRSLHSGRDGSIPVGLLR